MLRSNFDNEIIELSNNLEDIWDSIIKKYEIIFDTLTEVQKQSIIDNDLVIISELRVQRYCFLFVPPNV